MLLQERRVDVKLAKSPLLSKKQTVLLTSNLITRSVSPIRRPDHPAWVGAIRTSDSVAIPNIFLLNRRAVALAGAWKISDTGSFIVAHLIGEGLQCGLEPSKAITSAIAKLPDMTRSAVIVILTDSLPDFVQEKAIPRLELAPKKGMFSHAYFTAGLGVHGLLWGVTKLAIILKKLI